MSIYYADDTVTLLLGDALQVAGQLEDGSVDCIVTSPPYFGLRDYGIKGQYGLEASPAEYVETMRRLFAELSRVLADDGTLWLNLGDSYNNTASGQNGTAATGISGGRHDRMGGRRTSLPDSTLAGKNLLGIPWRVAFTLQADGWILRNAIIWNKPNAMPESVTDRLSGRYEMLFMFSKQQRYWFDLDPIREQPTDRKIQPSDFTKSSEPWGKGTGLAIHTGTRLPHHAGRNPGDVWSIPTQPFPGAHFAVYPVALPTRCIMAGCKPGGTVLDPFNGSGTTGLAAQRTGRKYIGIDLNAGYLDLSLRTRLNNAVLDLHDGETASDTTEQNPLAGDATA